VLEQEIVAAGGRYRRIVVYGVSRPRPPAPLVRSLLPTVAGGEGVDCLAFGSGQAARNFLRSVEEIVGEKATREICRGARIVALGPVTSNAIQTLGLRVHAVARDTSDAALVATIRETLAGTGLTTTS
jgi:uroporphyrinogen-III synthase